MHKARFGGPFLFGEKEMQQYTVRSHRTNEVLEGRSFDDRYYALCFIRDRDYNWERQYYIHDRDWRVIWDQVDDVLDLSEYGFEPIKDHYLRVDDESSYQSIHVTYFVDEWAGAKGRRSSPMKLGRYLKQFYPQLTDDEVTIQSTAINTKLTNIELKLAYSREEIRAIYEESHSSGVASCMSYPVGHSNWASWMTVHPTEAYSGPDLALAYIRHPTNGMLIGRAIVWPEKKYYSSCYGNYDKMRAALRQNGYEEGPLTGARMSRIVVRKDGNRSYLAMPYLDDTSYAHDDGEYLIMGRSSTHENLSGGASGYCSVYEYLCAITGEKIASNKLTTAKHPLDGSEVYINVDLRAKHTEEWQGYYLLKTDDESHYLTVAGGERKPAYVVHNWYNYCIITREWHRDGINTHDGFVCYKAFFENYVTCQVTRTHVRKDRAVWMEHGAWWTREALRSLGVTIDGKNYAQVLQATAVAA